MTRTLKHYDVVSINCSGNGQHPEVRLHTLIPACTADGTPAFFWTGKHQPVKQFHREGGGWTYRLACRAMIGPDGSGQFPCPRCWEVREERLTAIAAQRGQGQGGGRVIFDICHPPEE